MNEKNKEKEDLKKKVQKFWTQFKKNWLWINIGAYGSSLIIFWPLFIIGVIDLLLMLIITIGHPLFILIAYYGRVPKYEKIIGKIMLVGCGGFSLGGFLWLFLSAILIGSEWGPLSGLPPLLRGRLNLLLLFTSWGISSYIMYRFGKKRDWKPKY